MGSEQRFLTPFPRLAGPPGKLREARYCAQARYLRHICSESDAQDNQRDSRRPKGPQRTSKGSPRDSQMEPKGAKGYLGGLEQNKSKTNLSAFLIYDETNQLYRQLKSWESALILLLVTFSQENQFCIRNRDMILWSIRSFCL